MVTIITVSLIGLPLLYKILTTLILRVTSIEKINALANYQKVSKDNTFLVKLLTGLVKAWKGN